MAFVNTKFRPNWVRLKKQVKNKSLGTFGRPKLW